MLAAARRCQLQWCWAQATPDISALELTSSVPGGYLSDALVVYAEQHGQSAPPPLGSAPARLLRLLRARLAALSVSAL